MPKALGNTDGYFQVIWPGTLDSLGLSFIMGIPPVSLQWVFPVKSEGMFQVAIK